MEQLKLTLSDIYKLKEEKYNEVKAIILQGATRHHKLIPPFSNFKKELVTLVLSDLIDIVAKKLP